MTGTGNIIDLAAQRVRREMHRSGDPHAPGNYVAVRFPVEHLQLPYLVETVQAWYAKSGSDGIFRTSQRQPLTELMGTEVFGVNSMLVSLTSDQPESWLIGIYGNHLIKVTKGQYLARAFSELPGSIKDASVATLLAVLPEQRPVAHRITGTIFGRVVTYDRLILPVADRTGPVNRFITVSKRIDDDWDARQLRRMPLVISGQPRMKGRLGA